MPILTKNAALALVQDEVERLSTTVTEFNERAGQWVQLARFALAHDLEGVAALIRRAADCLLGYGWRKDPQVFDVLDAVRETHDPTTTPALHWIEALAPVIDKITVFTDGSGTPHARTEFIEVVAHTYPERLPLLFRAHIDSDEWDYADECLKHFVEVTEFDNSEAAALISTFLDPRTLGALEVAAKANTPAAGLLETQLTFLGGMPIDHDHRGSSSHPARIKRLKDPTKRGPRHFDRLVADVQDLSLSRDAVAAHFSAWLNHWRAHGKGKEALDSIRDYFTREEHAYHADEVLDLAFQLSLSVEGLDAAYWFLVTAHIRRHGWSSNYTSSDEVMQRLRWASEYYSDRWMCFIKDTSEPENYYRKLGYGFSIGHKYLVRFLLLVGQRDLAAKIVDTFVRTMVEEVRDQPIPETPWFQ